MNPNKYAMREYTGNRKYLDYLESKKTGEEDEEDIISSEFAELKLRFEMLKREVQKEK